MGKPQAKGSRFGSLLSLGAEGTHISIRSTGEGTFCWVLGGELTSCVSLSF